MCSYSFFYHISNNMKRYCFELAFQSREHGLWYRVATTIIIAVAKRYFIYKAFLSHTDTKATYQVYRYCSSSYNNNIMKIISADWCFSKLTTEILLIADKKYSVLFIIQTEWMTVMMFCEFIDIFTVFWNIFFSTTET